MRLALIPARGGSKRIPRKNIKSFHGHPMIAWSIEAARASKQFDKIVVSTDSAEIAEVAVRYGAEVPFVRPAELCDDYTGVMPVVAHAIDWHRGQGLRPDPVCLIYATAPFVTAADITRGLQSLEESGAQFAVAMASFAAPIQRALRLIGNGRVAMFHPEHYHTRSQDLEEAFHDAGQFSWGRAEAWRSLTPGFLSDCVAVPIPRHRVQDIDTVEDWRRAELLFAVSREFDSKEGQS
jgi:N-acylneuraminate cytidylyltransferase